VIKEEHSLMKSILQVFVVSCLIVVFVTAQDRRDKAVFVQPKNEFYDSIRIALDKFFQKPVQHRTSLRLDFSAIQAPTSTNEFTTLWHTKPVSQAISGMCWCYSTTSFLESEIKRLSKREIKLSELFTVYWEYVEKARGFVESRGTTEFGQGSQGNAVFRSWMKRGIVPAEAYTGLLNGQPFHDHDKMFDEMRTYLFSLKTSSAWDANEAERTVRAIMDHYIGAPPETIIVNGRSMTPVEYAKNVVRLNLDDYVLLCSFMHKPYDTMVEYPVPDNWWHSAEYFNIPLDEYMRALKRAVREGYTMAIWGDVSEPGLEGHAGLAVVPSFDIPSSFIDEHARQFRFSNGTTSDDHGIHLVGFTEMDGKDWYLIKDSGAGSRNNSHPGYYFYHEDYVKLKMLGFMVHRSAIPDIAARMPK
jgi:bleomycin hydrolase